MKIQSYLTLLLVISVLSACVQTDTPEPEQAAIYGFWRLQSGVFIFPQNDEVEFNPLAYLLLQEDSNMDGFTSRNQISGDFTFDEAGEFALNLQRTTFASDSPWSALFVEKVAAVDRYELEDNELILTDSETEQRLTFLNINEETCQTVTNDRERFLNATSDEFDLKDVKLVNGCLEVYIAYGGGCEAVALGLIGGEDYAESLPPQLSVRLVLDDDDNCEALVQERFYFDLTEFQYDGLDDLILNLEDWKDQIRVVY
ncbi:MAG: hypothetical protein AAGI49_08935 [Bacteroidota bacterium]